MNDKKDYWNTYWNLREIDEGDSPHQDIGRTINGVPVERKNWDKTLDYISNKLSIELQDSVLDICAGNGIISKHISKKCSQVTSVDFSERLLKQIDVLKFKNIEVILADARKIVFENNSFDKIIFYFSIQHFTKSEVIQLFRKFYGWLKPGGLLFVGDIPDSSRIWNFFNTEERRKIYFKSLESNSPVIGTWFDKIFFENLSQSLGFDEFNSIDQPKYQINSHYRFDFTSTKK